MESDSQPTPSTSLGDIRLGPAGSKPPKDTDFTCCIICYSVSGKQHNVTETSLVTLKRAMNAQQDSVWDRLSADLEMKTFLEDKKPKWHPRCRFMYLMKSSRELTEKKQNDPVKNKPVIDDD